MQGCWRSWIQRVWQQSKMPLCRQCKPGLQQRVKRLPQVRALLCIIPLRRCVLSFGSCKQRRACSSLRTTPLSAVLSEMGYRIPFRACLIIEVLGCAVGQPLLEHFVASRALRRLLLRGNGCSPDAEQAQAFADKLWSKRLQGHCNQLVKGHAAKVSCQHPPTGMQLTLKFAYIAMLVLLSCATVVPTPHSPHEPQFALTVALRLLRRCLQQCTTVEVQPCKQLWRTRWSPCCQKAHL